MGSAQDQAFAELISARGLLEANALAAAQASGESLPQTLVSQGLLAPARISGLLRELTRASFACHDCGMRFRYDSLSRLPNLSCPGCAGTIVRSNSPPTTGSLPAISPVSRQPQSTDDTNSGSSFPTSMGPTGTVRASGLGAVPFETLTEAPAAREVPPTMGPYTLRSELGRGSYGAVYLATKEGLERRFALKVLLDSEFADHETIARFELEAKVASKIDDPGVLGVYDVGRDGDHLYYVMEYCPGDNLKQRLREGRFDPRKAAKLVRRIAKTLISTHEKGVIHRDIKPSNIILDQTSGRPRVTDFGLARDHSLLQSMTQSGDLLGTPHYMSPEQFRGERGLDHRIDIYALGVIFYECLTGERPFSGSTPVELCESVCGGEIQHPSSIVPAIPRDVAAICLKAMSTDPDDRYPSARELVDDLERFLEGGAPVALLESSRQLNTAMKAAGLLVLIAALLGAGVLFKGTTGNTDNDVATDPVAARLLLTKAKAVLKTKGPTAAARDQLERAMALSPEASPLRRTIERELGILRGWELLEAARAEAGRRGPYEEIVAKLNEARGLAGEHASTLKLAVLLETARLSIRRGRPKKALQAAGSIPPGSGEGSLEARRVRALALELQGETGQALAQYRTLSELDTEGAHGICAAAAIKRRQGGEISAINKLARRALKLKPRWVPALIELGYALLEGDDLDGAEQAFTQAKDLSTDDPRILVGLGRLRLKEKKPASALQMFQAALDLHENPKIVSRAQVPFGLALFRLNRLPEAAEAFSRVLEKDDSNLEALLHRGVITYAQGDQDATEADWMRAYTINAMRCQELLERWHSEASAKAFHKVSAGSAIDDDKDPEFFALGKVREEMIRHYHSRRLEALKLPKLIREDLLSALLAAARAQPWDEISAPLRRGLRLMPRSAPAHSERLRLLASRDETKKGFAALREIRALDGIDVALDNTLRLLSAELNWRAGRLGTALEQFNALATRDPDGTSGQLAHAQAAWLEGNCGQVLAVVRNILKKDKHNAVAQTLKAMALIMLGRPREALAPLRDAYSRIGALDSRLLAVRTALLLEFRRATQGSTIFDMAQEFRTAGSIPEHLGVCPSYFDDRVAARLALGSASRGPVEWAHAGLPSLNTSDPDRPHTLLLMGYSAALKGRSKVAARHWRRARTLDPSLPIPRSYALQFVEAGGSTADAKVFSRR